MKRTALGFNSAFEQFRLEIVKHCVGEERHLA
jgi:hypothetical protein